MDLGFDTVGNATLIAYDKGPVLVTDPWRGGPAYFGSWGLSHEIPEEQDLAISAAPFVWFSHGHPDHLHPGSLASCKDKQVLLADHVGGRIASDLRGGGYQVTVLEDRRWLALSDRIRVMCLADYNQDSILLIDLGGRLIVNLNDSNERGWGGYLRRLIRQYPISFLLRLSGYGDADMINFVDESGTRLPNGPELRIEHGYQVGAQISGMTDAFGARFFVPFSSFHRYQRTDSVWANQCTTPLEAMAEGYESTRSELLPAFLRYDCTTDSVQSLPVSMASPLLVEPEDFDDNWDDELSTAEAAQVSSYFTSVQHLSDCLEFVTVRVGGKDTVVPLGRDRHGRGVTFAVPRHSLLRAIEWEIFDDLLIGNFMATTLHGRWPESKLSVDLTPYVAKYADNGRARTHEELRTYFAAYRQRMGTVRYLRHAIERQAKHAVRTQFGSESAAMAVATGAYRRVVSRS